MIDGARGRVQVRVRVLVAYERVVEAGQAGLHAMMASWLAGVLCFVGATFVWEMRRPVRVLRSRPPVETMAMVPGAAATDAVGQFRE